MRRIALFGSLFLLACSGGDTHAARAVIAVSPESLAFDAVPGARPLTIRNDGGALLTVTSLELRNVSFGAVFSASPTSFEVPAGTSVEVTVAYVPSGPGGDYGTLRIHSNADNAPERDVPLSADERGEEHDGGTAGPAPDAGTTTPPGCQLVLGEVHEIASVSGTIADLAIAGGTSGATVGWWTDARDLGVRALDASGLPSGTAKTVYHPADSRFPVGSLAGAADPAGAVFFATEETAFNEKLHRIDLRGAGPSGAEFDVATDMVSLAATASANGIAALWRKTGAGAGVVAVREGGSAPFARLDTGLPTENTFAHSISANGDGLFVAWHGTTGGESPISGALLDRTGKLVSGSTRALSSGGTKNVRPAAITTSAGLAVAWMQDGGSARNAVVSRLSDALAPLDGDVTLGRIGPAGAVPGNLAAAALGDLAVVAFSRFDDAGHALGLSVAAIDRRTGRVLDTRSLDRPDLAPYTDLALGGSPPTLVFADAAGSERIVQGVTLRCE